MVRHRFFVKKSWTYGRADLDEKVTRKAPQSEKTGKSMVSGCCDPLECSDRSHNVCAASGHEYYRLRALRHHPSSFTVRFCKFLRTHKVRSRAPKPQNLEKSRISGCCDPVECSDRFHNVCAGSRHEYYRFRALHHHPSSFTIEK